MNKSKNSSVLSQEVFELVLSIASLARSRNNFIELFIFDKFTDNINASLEFSFDKDLRKSRPVRVELQPLSYPFVSQDIETSKFIANTLAGIFEGSHELLGELTLGSVLVAFHKNEHFTACHKLLDVLEGVLLLLLKEGGVLLFELIQITCELRNFRVDPEVKVLPSWFANAEARDTLNSEALQNLGECLGVGVEPNIADSFVDFGSFGEKLFDLNTAFVPLRVEKGH